MHNSFCSVAAEAMQEFLRHTDSQTMLDYLEKNDAWTLLEKEDTCPHGCLHFARYSIVQRLECNSFSSELFQFNTHNMYYPQLML